jgi:hypothetical protein
MMREEGVASVEFFQTSAVRRDSSVPPVQKTLRGPVRRKSPANVSYRNVVMLSDASGPERQNIEAVILLLPAVVK